MTESPVRASGQPIDNPGREQEMAEQPRDEMAGYRGRELLAGQVALVTGADSGIGRAVAVGLAKEGADIAVAYLDEHRDAERTRELVTAAGRRCLLLPGDLAEPAHARSVVAQACDGLGRLDVLICHHGTQQEHSDPLEISDEQWQRTLAVNVSSFFYLVKAALPLLPDGGAIVLTGSVNALRGNAALIDYSASKAAIHALAQSLAQALAGRRIRVNVVAPGPVWSPLIPATMPAEKVAGFGEHTPLGRPAQPDEIAPSFVFLACGQLSSYYTGQTLTPFGGETHPG